MREPEDIKIGDYTLEEILERHLHWLNRDCENWESMRADLHDADLHDANMSYANMSGVNMSYANMCGADMSYTNISYANMRDADLHDANMSYANMIYTIMINTNMIGADLSNANMRGADMRGAKMIGADLNYADLRGAKMIGAELNYADLRGANMIDADLRGADKLRKGIKLSEPIIGWKKCKNNVLVKLEIPRGAIVFSINNSKCRTDKAKVLEIIGGDRAYSKHKFFSYYVGDVIEIFDFNCEYNDECAEGIHFFRTKEEAEHY